MEFKPVRNTELCNHNPPACNYISSNMHMQPTHEQMKHSLAHLQDLIPTLTGIKHISNDTSQSSTSMYKTECFICTFVWLHVHV